MGIPLEDSAERFVSWFFNKTSQWRECSPPRWVWSKSENCTRKTDVRSAVRRRLTECMGRGCMQGGAAGRVGVQRHGHHSWVPDHVGGGVSQCLHLRLVATSGARHRHRGLRVAGARRCRPRLARKPRIK